MKSSKNLTKMSFGKPPSCSDQIKTKVVDLSSVAQNQDLARSHIQNTNSAGLIQPKNSDNAYKLSGNNILMNSHLIGRPQNEFGTTKGKSFSSQSILKQNINALSQIISGPVKKTAQPNSAREMSHKLPNNTSMKEIPVDYPYRRETELQREMGEFISNYSQSSYNKKKESLQKSTSWAKFGDSTYCSHPENHSRKSSKHQKIRKSLKTKNQSINNSGKKLKKTKKKLLKPTSSQTKRIKKKQETSFGLKQTHKAEFSTNKDKFSSKNKNKNHSNSCINLLIPNDSNRSQLERTATLDISSLKRNIKNYSPSRGTDFYEPNDEFTHLMTYNDLKLQNTMDMRVNKDFQKLVTSNRNPYSHLSNDSYLDYQVKIGIIHCIL